MEYVEIMKLLNGEIYEWLKGLCQINDNEIKVKEKSF